MVKEPNSQLALKYYSIAAFLYPNPSQDFQEAIAKIASFPDSEIKAYALARAQASKTEPFSLEQRDALKAVKNPLHYLLQLNSMIRIVK